ncbi:MAG: VOC family protein [bacterium]|nr:VOC family protein [bacterium]MDE0353508.1 VOC family protein [bacterium]
MIERFDHAVIGVPDLESAMGAFRRLGFEVAVGGRHPSLGTRNAIVRFGLDYLELLTVEDPAVARARGPFGRELLSFLDQGSGLVGFVLAGTGLEDEVEGLRGLGIGAEGPFEMDRIHPKGGRLEWRLVLPGGSPWRKPWPYLIDWITGEGELLAWDPPGDHGNLVTGVAGIDLVVGDLDEAARLYERALGLRAGDGGHQRPGASSRQYRLGSFRLALSQPDGPGPVATELERRGPGPYSLVLASSDLDSTAEMLARAGVRISRSPAGLDIDPSEAAGARIRIVPA